MRHHGRRVRQQRLQHPHIARRRRHTGAWSPPQPQPELQLIPGLAPSLPLRQLVRPGRVELRSAQRLGLMRRKQLRRRPVRPGQHPPPRVPVRPSVGRRTGHDPAFPEHHHLARLIDRFRDQCHPPRLARVARPRALDHRPHPFRPGPRFPRAAAPHDDPGPPVALGRQLMRQRPEFEHPRQRPQRRDRQPVQKISLIGNTHGDEQVGTRSRIGRHRNRCRRQRRVRLPRVQIH